MIPFSSYLVCREHVQEVRKFLNPFLKEKTSKYTHEKWITFQIPNSEFTVNLMKGADQPRTRNFTFEIGCSSMKELEGYAKKFNCKIENFRVTETTPNYTYHYIEIYGPEDICKVEISFCEH